jgi:anionic cell wall polymer biosynthesis LytR-Cps2A-Psr (LCP) family protein
MQPISLLEVIKHVLTSWQVLVITIVIILFTFLVSYTAKSYHRPRSFKKVNMNVFKKKNAQPATQGGPEETTSGDDPNAELGLEEAP